MLLNQLREITGVQDPSFLHEALKVGFKSPVSHKCKTVPIIVTSVQAHFMSQQKQGWDRSSIGQMTQYVHHVNYKGGGVGDGRDSQRGSSAGSLPCWAKEA